MSERIPSATAGRHLPKTNPLKVDEQAFLALYRRADITGRAYSLDCVDHALDHLLANPDRNSSGQKLANSVYRDARKSLRNRPRPAPLERATLVPAKRHDGLQEEETHREVAGAAKTLRAGLDDLPARLKTALALSANGEPQECAADRLGVKPRQYRNLIRQAQTMLKQSPGFAVAMATIKEGFVTAPTQAADVCGWALEGWVRS